MRAFHNTRDEAYRSPFGAIAVGEEVVLSLDVADAPGSAAVVRTWFEGVGEELHEMEPVEGEGGDGVRFQATLKPESAGIVWYQFVITDAEGRPWRYGARNGRSGGTGQLVGWEPPSFQLTVFDPRAEPPVWHDPINGYLHDEAPGRGLEDVVATMLENYPTALCETASPWPVDVGADRSLPDELSTMEKALTTAVETGGEWFALNEDIFGFWRKSEAGLMCCALFNASPHIAYDVPVPMVNEEVSDVLGGYGVKVAGDDEAGDALPFAPNLGRYALVHLWQFGSAILHFHNEYRLARPMEPGLGVLAHITSLPTEDGGRGTLGAPARAFIDWLAEAGVKYWQVLPVNPTDECGSPYAGISAFAGNVLLLEGGVNAVEKLDVDDGEYAAFCEREADWLEPYAAFMAIRQKVGDGVAWQKWPKKYRAHDASVIGEDKDLKAAAEACKRSQFAFERQWKELRAYANERGVLIVGDIPIYVSADSADVWAHPELFQLGCDGMPAVVAGCPPDAFAPEGQIWGNPVYDWDTARSENYAWWMRRLRRVFDLYDYVRLDHFIGFSRYFSIPVGEEATEGKFRLGPGYDLFKRARFEFGPLPIIAEDLGLITPRVRSLVADCGFPGMDILQFADGNDPLSGYAPRPEKIAYTGTHDNQTIVGYVRDRYPEADEAEAADKLIDMVVNCEAPVRILPLQDVLRQDDEARMNVPGVAEGNWTWQAKASDMRSIQPLVPYTSG